MTLSLADRQLAVKVGWQAECAVVPDATRFAADPPVPVEGVCPLTIAGCVELGRGLLRVHAREVAQDERAADAARRRSPRRSRVVIELVVRGRQADVEQAIEDVLDAGQLQDAINAHPRRVRVESAVSK